MESEKLSFPFRREKKKKRLNILSRLPEISQFQPIFNKSKFIDKKRVRKKTHVKLFTEKIEFLWFRGGDEAKARELMDKNLSRNAINV